MGDLGLGGIIGGAFSYMGAEAQANAAKQIASAQLAAINQQRTEIQNQLEPGLVSDQALNADVNQAQNRLGLQQMLDPNLTATRYNSEANLAQASANPRGQGDALANQLVSEIGQPNAQTEALKKRLMDAAADDLEQGAKLPPDVQSELIKAGLERSGSMGTGTSKNGAAGDLATRLVGQEGLALQAQRRQEAQGLANTADTLANRRYALLSSVFPNLKALQTQNTSTAAGLFGVANGAVPSAGLGGGDLTNVLMARVGANNALTSQTGNVLAGQAQAQGTAAAAAYGAIGSAARGAASSPAASYLWNSVFSPSSGGSGSYTGNWASNQDSAAAALQ